MPKLKFVKPIGGFHGVSAVFPKLKDIIDNEEKKIIINQGYPRFVTHPLVKKVEIENKKKFNALGVISCHNYEIAIFLVVDYFFKHGNKLYFDAGLPIEFYTFLNEKFPKTVKISDISEANVLNLKGPSLGSEKTLISPYVIMAHYEDSKEELAQKGLDFYLMRLSVGIENVDNIIYSLNHVLNLII